jgi:putative phosphoesterase
MTIGLISDTHGYLDPQIFKMLNPCDEIWHAGDMGNAQLLDALVDFKPLRAVYGNIDGQDVRFQVPENQIFTIEGLKIFMTHIGGNPSRKSGIRYFPKPKKIIHEEQPDLFVCGHSHILRVLPDKENKLLFLNPGACGHHGSHIMRTAMMFGISSGKLVDLKVIEFGRRGR